MDPAPPVELPAAAVDPGKATEAYSSRQAPHQQLQAGAEERIPSEAVSSALLDS